MCCEIGPVWSERSVKTTHYRVACDHWSWTTRGSLRRGNVTTSVYLILHFRSPFVRSTTRHENVAVKILRSLSSLTLSRPRKSACGRKQKRENFKTCHVKFIHVSLACFDLVRTLEEFWIAHTHWQPARAEEFSPDIFFKRSTGSDSTCSLYIRHCHCDLPGKQGDGDHDIGFGRALNSRRRHRSARNSIRKGKKITSREWNIKKGTELILTRFILEVLCSKYFPDQRLYLRLRRSDKPRKRDGNTVAYGAKFVRPSTYRIFKKNLQIAFIFPFVELSYTCVAKHIPIVSKSLGAWLL